MNRSLPPIVLPDTSTSFDDRMNIPNKTSSNTLSITPQPVRVIRGEPRVLLVEAVAAVADHQTAEGHVVGRNLHHVPDAAAVDDDLSLAQQADGRVDHDGPAVGAFGEGDHLTRLGGIDDRLEVDPADFFVGGTRGPDRQPRRRREQPEQPPSSRHVVSAPEASASDPAALAAASASGL